MFNKLKRLDIEREIGITRGKDLMMEVLLRVRLSFKKRQGLS